MKILMVCLGNICRSPLAEGLLRREIDRAGLDWEVSSGGTAGYHVGNPPDPRSIAVAAAHGLDISAQRSHQVTRADLEAYDLVFGMDRQNVADLKQLARTQVRGGGTTSDENIRLYLDYTGLRETDGPDVFDPYYDDDGFAGVYDLLERAAKRAVASIREEDDL